MNEKGGYFGNTLQTALYKGNHDADIVRSWKEWDSADVNAMGGHYGKCPAGSAFQAALSQGHAQIVELLMENVQLIVAGI